MTETPIDTKVTMRAVDAHKIMRERFLKMSPADRAEVLTLCGKDLANMTASYTLGQMLAEKQVTGEELAKTSGLPVEMIAKIIRGEQEDGPMLWQLIALADALELDLQLSFTPQK